MGSSVRGVEILGTCERIVFPTSSMLGLSLRGWGLTTSAEISLVSIRHIWSRFRRLQIYIVLCLFGPQRLIVSTVTISWVPAIAWSATDNAPLHIIGKIGMHAWNMRGREGINCAGRGITNHVRAIAANEESFELATSLFPEPDGELPAELRRATGHFVRADQRFVAHLRGWPEPDGLFCERECRIDRGGHQQRRCCELQRASRGRIERRREYRRNNRRAEAVAGIHCRGNREPAFEQPEPDATCQCADRASELPRSGIGACGSRGNGESEPLCQFREQCRVACFQ